MLNKCTVGLSLYDAHNNIWTEKGESSYYCNVRPNNKSRPTVSHSHAHPIPVILVNFFNCDHTTPKHDNIAVKCELGTAGLVSFMNLVHDDALATLQNFSLIAMYPDIVANACPTTNLFYYPTCQI